MFEQLTSTDEFHDEVELHISLENELHTDKERMVGLLKDLLLELGGFNLVVVKDHILAQRLHSEHVFGSLLLNKEDLAEGTTTDDGLGFEVRKLWRRTSILFALIDGHSAFAGGSDLFIGGSCVDLVLVLIGDGHWLLRSLHAALWIRLILRQVSLAGQDNTACLRVLLRRVDILQA